MAVRLSLLALFCCVAAHAEPPNHGRWKLVFEDTFEGDALDWSRWASQAGPSGHILSSRWPENVEVRDGLLRLVTRKESRAGQDWTSANVWVEPQRFGHGYYEARYRYGGAPGLNNAFWVWRDQKWMTAGQTEIDFNEGHHPNEINTNLHLHSDGPEHRHFGISQARAVEGADLSETFHTYGCEWNEHEIIYYFDGEPIRRLPHRVALTGPMKLLFSTAVVDWAGALSDALDGTAMEVDWVRVWEPVGAVAPPAADLEPQVPFGGAVREVRALPGGEGWRTIRGVPEVVDAAALPASPLVPEGGVVRADPRTVPPPAGTTRVLKLAAPGDFVYAPFPPTAGRLRIDLDVLPSSDWCPFMIVGLGPGFDAAAVAASADVWSWVPATGPYLMMFEGGYPRVHHDGRWHEAGLVTMGQWLRLSLVLDPAAGAFDVYADGRLLGSGRFRHAQPTLSGLGVMLRESGEDAWPLHLGNVVVSMLE